MAEIATLLRERGHGVEVLERSSAELRGSGRARAGTAMLAGGLEPGEVAEAVRRTGADVVHAHNIHPLLGSRALGRGAAGRARRWSCTSTTTACSARSASATGTARVCTRCRGRNVFPGVRLRCRGNLPEAAAYGAGLWRQQPRIVEAVGRFVAPSAFAADRLGELGLQRDAISVAHNFLPRRGVRRRAAGRRSREYALFAGPAGGGEGRRDRGRGGRARRRAAGGRGERARRPAGDPEHRRACLGQLDAERDAGGAAPRGVRGGALALGRALSVLGDRGDGGRRARCWRPRGAGCRRWWARRARFPTATWRLGAGDAGAVERPASCAAPAAAEALARARDLFGPERFYAALMDAYAAAGAR